MFFIPTLAGNSTPILGVFGLYLWFSAATERSGLFLRTRVGALDREIARLERARSAAGELVEALRAG